MGTYLNPGSKGFQESLNSDIYVDKTGLIEKTNAKINTLQKYLCISRPRRFGKSMAANMLAAYYDRETDSRHLFKHFQVSRITSYEEHRNQYDVIRVNIQEFLSVSHEIDEMLKLLQERLILELKRKYPEYVTQNNLMFAMQDVYAFTQHPFIILIDEWDCLFREYQHDQNAQKKYLDFLRSWLKDKEYVALAYMTGILPIKKYGSHSALNMFTEYSMTDPGDLAEYFGFTEDEVKALCETYKKDFTEVKRWYDGYQLGKYHVYNPNAVVNLMADGNFQSYWSGTASYDSIVPLINMDFDGLKTAIIEMVSGASVEVDVGSFQNDVENIVNKDDVLTYLIHMGYLAYSSVNRMAFVPNEEIRQELIRATKRKEWNEMLKFQQESEDLLDATLDMDGEIVAAQIEKIHEEYVSAIQYNNENSLSSVLALAYLSAMQYYFKPVREFPTGRGFADFVFIPKTEYRNDYPALVVELKWNKSAVSALQQIKDKKYPDSIQKYAGNILLVGINYSKKEKKHECMIEEYLKK